MYVCMQAFYLHTIKIYALSNLYHIYINILLNIIIKYNFIKYK